MLPCWLTLVLSSANAGDTGSTLVWEDATCLRGTKLMCLNYWATALEAGSHDLRSLPALGSCRWFLNKRSITMRSPHTAAGEWPPFSATTENPHSNENPAQHPPPPQRKTTCLPVYLGSVFYQTFRKPSTP